MTKLISIKSVVSTLALVAAVGGLAACSPKTSDAVASDTSTAMSDAGGALSDAGAAISDAVTPDSPQDFTTKAANANMFEIETSKLALKMGTRADVKTFAKQMVADHTKAGAKFKTVLAGDKDVTAPAALNDDLQKKLDDLKTKTKGDDFDNAYISAQKDAHSDAVSLFDNYAKNGTDAALKQFATDTLPTLQAHKDMIDKM